MIVFYDSDWFNLINDFDSQFEFVEITVVFFDNPLCSNPIRQEQGLFGMEMMDTFRDLRFAVEESLEFEVPAESFLLLWHDKELEDHDTPDSLGMQFIALGKPFKSKIF